jgi:hypothetical protein
MRLRADEGYAFIQTERTKDGKFKVVQLKRELMREFKGLFDIESDNGLMSKEDVQYELNNIYDFATSFLVDALKPENHKIEILTKDEFDDKFNVEEARLK